MKTSLCHWPLAVIGWASFVVSFFVPAFDQMAGWKAAVLQQSFWQPASHGNVLAAHYMLLALANLAMLVSPYFIIRGTRDGAWVRWLRGVSLAAAVLVWLFPVEMMRIGMARDLRVGFYLWAASFVLIFVAAWIQPAPAKVNAERPG
ncbi:MAG: hypothetical protein ACREFR_02360 [Limisphaerales bacterium]